MKRGMPPKFLRRTFHYFLLVLLFAFISVSTGQAAVTKTLRDNATGGDCTSVGAWNNDTKTCTLNTDFNGTIGIVNDGITLDGAGHSLSGPRLNGGLVFNTSGVTVKNLHISGFVNGVLITGGSGNSIICNTIEGNDYGVYIDGSASNIITLNNISGNGTGIESDQSSGNSVTDNIFTGNTDQAVAAPGGTDTFSGNYFDDFDAPGEGCADLNSDGYCDTPYLFSGGSDSLARTVQLDCVKPDLRLFKDSVSWASYSDYTAGWLSVSYSISNMSAQTAYDSHVTGSTGTGGVTCLTAVPQALGDISGGGTVSTTLKYSLPSGLAGFTASVTGSASNACGTSFTYPT